MNLKTLTIEMNNINKTGSCRVYMKKIVRLYFVYISTTGTQNVVVH